jgi:hypothetical protein
MDNYQKIKNELTKIINDIDPWGLIAAGAPEDEYDGMINQTISLYLDKKLNSENLRKIWGATEISELIIVDIQDKVNRYFGQNN